MARLRGSLDWPSLSWRDMKSERDALQATLADRAVDFDIESRPLWRSPTGEYRRRPAYSSYRRSITRNMNGSISKCSTQSSSPPDSIPAK